MPYGRSPHPSRGPLLVSAGTDRGRKRRRNEDSVRIADPMSRPAQERGWLGVVADGLGGRPGGDRASQLATETIHEVFYAHPNDDESERLAAAINRAHHSIARAPQQAPDLRGMASTVVAAVVRDMRLTVAWVGDSRAYLVRNGITRCLTADHSWVGEAVARRLLTEEQAVDHPRRNQITRSLGSADTPTIDIVEELLEPGDTIVLCSDGLYRLVDQDEFSALVRGGIAGAAQRLVTLANDRGGDDNVTVVVARVPGGTADDFSTMPTLVDPRGGWDAESSGSGAAPYRTTAPWMALAAITVVTAVAVFLILLAVERWYWPSTGAPSVSTPTPSRAGIAPTLIPATTVSPTVAPLPTMVTLVPPRDGVGRSSHDGDHASKFSGRADATTARLAIPPTRLDVRGSFRTTRECWQTEKSHISHVVLDTTTWEASVAFQLATSSLVQTYARNDHLELAISYDFLGHQHRYYPDFIVRLTNGVSLLLEVKGQEDEQDRQKYTAARRWAEAVTAWGEMGVWHFDVCQRREDVPAILARYAALASAAA